ncbi:MULTISPECIES: DUF4124 domain-containing protein [unclassified Acinetobacter]|uniref:DUF4124 domain-containing protein n=1 Tax=unclassified Acinetobacter TaxID=196816 RepID=UPI00190A8360|nr:MULTISPECIES: DUF4124 domain-containing protein [unclassified Acinetobacter]MBK0063397.1 DUF4124 domain-containing protein [Acinetobacter sp. S55]MBK0066691.1 DUF4124 domain-containing protein [Acinetobacter sp. S54]
MNSVIYGRIWAVAGLMLLGCLSQSNAKQYYKWVDANGVTTYSATPPPTQRSNEPQLSSQKTAPMNQNKPTTNFKSNASIADEYYNPYKQSIKPPATPVSTEKENPPKLNKTETTQTVQTTSSSKKLTYMIKDCNGVRCSDHKGNNYNKVTGNTYLSSRGGVCQMTGSRMECNK